MSRVPSLKDPALRAHLDGAGGRSRRRRGASRHGEREMEEEQLDEVR
jgi:hypothetical protein